jgi:hypothetical protein
MNKRDWAKVLFQNRRILFSLTKEGAQLWRAARKRQKTENLSEADLISR